MRIATSGLRILYFIDSLGYGGAERSLAAMAPYYVKAGVELEVAYFKKSHGVRAELESAGARLFCLEGSGGRIARTRRARRLIGDRRPNLIHTTLFEADVAGRIAGFARHTPVVSSLVNVTYGPEMLSDPRLKPWKVRGAQAVDWATGRAVTRWHAITEHVAEVMAHRLSIPRTRIDVIVRGRDPQTLGERTTERYARMRASLGIADRTPLVVAAARHEYQKGLDVLIEGWPVVLHSMPQARLLIAGRQGNETSLLRDRVSNLGLDDSVTFLGAREDVPDLLAAADLFTLPSRWEGMASVLVEALALEAPIVASDLPPVREVLANSAAGLVPSEDPDLLGSTIVGVLSDRSLAEAQAKRGRSRFLEQFTAQRVTERMLALYERALHRGTIRRSVAPSLRARSTRDSGHPKRSDLSV